MKKKIMFAWHVGFDDTTSINVTTQTLRKAVKLAIKGHNKGIKQRVTAKNITFIRRMGEW